MREWVLSVGVLKGGVGVEGVGVLRGWVLTDARDEVVRVLRWGVLRGGGNEGVGGEGVWY